MAKLKLLKLVNVLLAFDFLIVVISVILYKFIPGTLNGSELMSNLHGLSGVIFLILVSLHVFLNFNWIKLTYFKK